MLENLRNNKKMMILVVAGLVVVALLLLLLILMQGSGGGDNVQQTPSPAPVTGVPNDNTDDGTDPNGGTTDPGDDDTPGGDEVVIKWWGAFLSEEDVQPVIDAFESEYPDVKIEYSSQLVNNRGVSAYKTKLEDTLQDTNSGVAPDIFMLDNGWSGSLLAFMEPAPDNIVNVSSVGTDYYQFVESDFVLNGEIYGLPVWADTLALIYNKDLWADAGLTGPDQNWNKFANDQVPALTKKDGNTIQVSGFAAGNTDNSEFWFEALNMLMLQNQVEMIDENGTAIFAENSDSIDAVEFYKQFSGDTWDESFNLDVAAFLEGKLATYLAPSWRLNDIVRYNEVADLGLNIGVVEVPQLQTSGSFKANFATYWANSVNASSANPDIAWEFANFVSQPEQLELLNTTIKSNNPGAIGILYPRRDMSSKQTNDKNLGAYASALDYSMSWFMVDEQLMRDAFAPILESNEDLETVQEEANLVLTAE